MPYVYVLRCSDGSLYVGHTDDLDARLRAHEDGVGSDYTAARRPVVMVYSEPLDTLAQAIARERQLKRWSATKKEALIAGAVQTLKSLAKRHKTAGRE